MEEQKTLLLRFFAEDAQARKKALEPFVLCGQVDAVSREKNGETLLLLTSRLETAAAGQVALDHCRQQIRQACGAGLYGTGNTTLFACLIEAMQQRGMLFVAADTATRDLLNAPLSRLEQAGSVYDFGELSCGHEKIGKKIQAAGEAETFPLAAAQKRIAAACALTGADWGATGVATEKARTVVVGNAKGCWVCPVQEGQRPVLWLVDMLRRAALGAEQASGVTWVAAKAETPFVAEDTRQHRRRVLRALSAGLAALLVMGALTLGVAFWATGGQSQLLWELTL